MLGSIESPRSSLVIRHTKRRNDYRASHVTVLSKLIGTAAVCINFSKEWATVLDGDSGQTDNQIGLMDKHAGEIGYNVPRVISVGWSPS